MRVLHLSTTDIHGGAGRAAHRIHHALLAAGVESRMSVRVKLGNEWHVRSGPHSASRVWATLWAQSRMAMVQKTLRPTAPFSTQFMSGDGVFDFQQFDPEIIHLHWICDGFLGIGKLGRLSVPVVWTLHDQWPFTGGCHYSGACDRFTARCGRCPILGERRERDVSRRVFLAKQRRWKKLNVSVISPSHWMSERAARSTLFHNRSHSVIPNPIDLRTFRPVPKDAARIQLGLELTKPTLLYVAMSGTEDQRKGFDLLEKTLRSLRSICDDLQLVVVGASGADSMPAGHEHTRFLGRLHEESVMAAAYSAADVFVAPSRQDNLPNTVAESLACGTPVAAFRVGGIPEMVDHQRTGFLAEPFDTDQLAQGIGALLSTEQREKLSAAARSTAENLFAPQAAADSYQKLYASLI